MAANTGQEPRSTTGRRLVIAANLSRIYPTTAGGCEGTIVDDFRWSNSGQARMTIGITDVQAGRARNDAGPRSRTDGVQNRSAADAASVAHDVAAGSTILDAHRRRLTRVAGNDPYALSTTIVTAAIAPDLPITPVVAVTPVVSVPPVIAVTTVVTDASVVGPLSVAIPLRIFARLRLRDGCGARDRTEKTDTCDQAEPMFHAVILPCRCCIRMAEPALTDAGLHVQAAPRCKVPRWSRAKTRRAKSLQ